MRASADLLPPVPLSGIAELDIVHQRIWARLRQTQRAFGRRQLFDAMAGCVALMLELRAEYAAEEGLMTHYRYPGIPMHRASHAQLESDFSELTRAIRDAGPPASPETRARLAAMLLAATRRLAAHVLEADIPLAQFVRAARGADAPSVSPPP